MKLALIGFMASGKSSVAKQLSRISGMAVVATDTLALQISRMGSIREIFEKEGERGFRAYESRALEAALNSDSKILDLGGGIIESDSNILRLKATKIQVVWLKVSFETAKRRAAIDAARPLFDNPATARKLFNRRQAIYESVAGTVIENEGDSADETAKIIWERLELQHTPKL